jgi:Uma2 family endonuclease
MADPAHSPLLNVDDLYALPDDDWKHELQAGVLVSEPLPSLRHGQVAARVTQILATHVRRHGLGIVASNDSGFLLSRSPDTVRGPDVSFVSKERVEHAGDPRRPFPGPPDLAVEIRSPSNSPAGIHAKVADYLAAGTRMVWVVDPEAETVATYRSLLAPRTLHAAEELDGGDVLPGFRVAIAEIFES